MYTPNFKYTNKIVKDLMEIERIRSEINYFRIPRGDKRKIIDQAKLKKAHYSTAIEGNKLSYDQIVEIVKNKNKKTFSEDEHEVVNYLNALSFLEKSHGKEITLDLILEVHNRIIGGRESTFRGAMPPGVLFCISDSETNQIEYVPPYYEEIPKLMEDLISWYNSADDLPVLIRAAIFSYQFLTIHPFFDGNGRTIRALVNFILGQSDQSYNRLGAVEEFYYQDLTCYYEHLQMGLSPYYEFGRKNPPHLEHWIEYFVSQQRKNAESIYSRLLGISAREDNLAHTKSS